MPLFASVALTLEPTSLVSVREVLHSHELAGLLVRRCQGVTCLLLDLRDGAERDLHAEQGVHELLGKPLRLAKADGAERDHRHKNRPEGATRHAER
jgi:hypothetical protein